MKWIIRFTALLLVLLPKTHSFADEQTATLKLENMYCSSCPYIVKKTLVKVKGVSKVDISYDRKNSTATAVVTFDDSNTKMEDITKATANAGFPSKVIKESD